MKKICIVGMGYVGLTLAMHAVRNGYEVFGIEILDSTYNKILDGETHFYEPGLDELLKLSLGKQFFIHKVIPSGVSFDVFVVTVGTPLKNHQVKVPNMDYLENATKSIAPYVKSESLIILRSTIPVGSTAKVAEQIAEVRDDLKTVNISFCPERTAEGQALVELQTLPQIISGNTQLAKEKARKFFEPLTNEIIETKTLEEAELIKLFNNTFRDASFAIANTFNQIAQSFKIDGFSAIENANHNYSRSSIPKPGFVAGPCLEKDAYILSSNMTDKNLKNFLLKVRNANEKLEVLVANKIKKFVEDKHFNNILFSGLAFKGVPQTNDLRGSSSIKILNELLNYKGIIKIHDFMNDKEFLKETLGFESLDPDEIFEKNSKYFDFIIILNNNPKYNTIKAKNFVRDQIKKGSLVIDAWNVMNLSGQYTLANLFI